MGANSGCLMLSMTSLDDQGLADVMLENPGWHCVCALSGLWHSRRYERGRDIDNQDVTRKREKSMLVKWPVEALCDWRPCPPRVGTAGTSMHKQAHLGRVTSLDDPATACPSQVE